MKPAPQPASASCPQHPHRKHMMITTRHLRLVTALIAVLAAFVVAALPSASAAPQAPDDLRMRFEFLSANGNSNCSASFMAAFATMEGDARLQGSCCGPMDFHRYGEQNGGLKAFAEI